MRSTIGIKIATTAVELITALSMALANISIISILVVELLLFWLIQLPTNLATPVLSSISPTTSKPAMRMTTELPKPANAALTGSMLVSIRAKTTHIAIMS